MNEVLNEVLGFILKRIPPYIEGRVLLNVMSFINKRLLALGAPPKSLYTLVVPIPKTPSILFSFHCCADPGRIKTTEMTVVQSHLTIYCLKL
jgi:hypothetical protein